VKTYKLRKTLDYGTSRHAIKCFLLVNYFNSSQCEVGKSNFLSGIDYFGN
jgi:hypothetical protein